ncbi:MAG: glycoside hydrolase family 57 protein [Candidatus Cryptobacteroides sp.]|nr:glycoside hydrolase family 57 protein [Candidatus Cryptobacteroides sp.]
MKKSICLYFQVHQPTRLRQYRFFNIGKDSHYYDDFANRTILHRIASNCYLPMNSLILDLITKTKGAFKVAFSITGSALEQFDRYAPEVIDSFRKLAKTGSVEFLGETYYHSLASLANQVEFKHQVDQHSKAIQSYFGVKPQVFRNTELIYSDSIGKTVHEMGFKAMLTEGAKHVLGWKSPDYIYYDPLQPKLKLLLRNYSLSDDIAFRFSDKGWVDYPLTGEKYLSWLKAADGNIVNLFMDYETFGEHQNASTGIFDFMRYLCEILLKNGSFEFVTPSLAARKYKPVGALEVEDPISWVDEERDMSAWLGNELQQEAFNKLYGQAEKLALVNDATLWNDFGHLQESDHLYYMCTKFFSDGDVHKYFSPYETPYEAFINYMNVLSDFIVRIDDAMATGMPGVTPAPVKARKTEKKPQKPQQAPKAPKTPKAPKEAKAPKPAKAKPGKAAPKVEEIKAEDEPEVKAKAAKPVKAAVEKPAKPAKRRKES